MTAIDSSCFKCCFTLIYLTCASSLKLQLNSHDMLIVVIIFEDFWGSNVFYATFVWRSHDTGWNWLIVGYSIHEYRVLNTAELIPFYLLVGGHKPGCIKGVLTFWQTRNITSLHGRGAYLAIENRKNRNQTGWNWNGTCKSYNCTPLLLLRRRRTCRYKIIKHTRVGKTCGQDIACTQTSLPSQL